MCRKEISSPAKHKVSKFQLLILEYRNVVTPVVTWPDRSWGDSTEQYSQLASFPILKEECELEGLDCGCR